jgi:BirA family biotin operon repressor/biotin-[acetyl-CoA-carboxylase] ligase
MGPGPIFRGHLPDDVTDALARAGARLGSFTRISWHDEVGSTNDVAMAAATNGTSEGLVIAANSQSSGRGRLGRSWLSPPGAGLYVSVVLHPSRHALSLITIAAGVAVAEGIEAASGLHAGVKWPNDVYVGGRKLAGILAEAGSLSSATHVVLGFGINLRPAALPPEVAVRATSIESELGRPADRGLVLVECLAALANRCEALQHHREGTVIAAWRSRAAQHLGRSVEWDADAGVRHGIAQDIDSAGALLVRVGDEIVRVISGEVRWVS